MEKKDFIINLIRQKKELSGIDKAFINGLLEDYLSKNKNLWQAAINHPNLSKSREAKLIIKNIRKRLREIYGAFHIDMNKRIKLLHKLEDSIKNKAPKAEIFDLHEKILLTHKSTRERLDYYDGIYKSIFKITGKPHSILDIACGLNPLSIIFTGLKNVRYIAIELTEEDCSFLRKYFKIMHLNGIAIKKDLISDNIFPKTDVCFLFKVLDSLEAMKQNISEKLLDKIDAKFIVVSFPKKTLSGKPLSTKRLSWFRKIAKDYIKFEVENEIFYIINKNK